MPRNNKDNIKGYGTHTELNSREKREAMQKPCNSYNVGFAKKEFTSSYLKEKMTRRQVLFYLGGGVVAAITGFFTFPSIVMREGQSSGSPATDQTNCPVKPCLKSGFYRRQIGELTKLEWRNKENAITCAVNDVGICVVELLNGQHTIEDISKHVAKKYRLVHTEAMDAGVACFVAQLAMLDYLAEPFYTQIYEIVEEV